MPATTAIIATVTAGEVLTLALPLGVLVAVLAWYTWLWGRGAGER